MSQESATKNSPLEGSLPWQRSQTDTQPGMTSPPFKESGQKYPWESKPFPDPTLYFASQRATIHIQHPPNWPPCKPIIYYDIENDISPSKQLLAYRSYQLWMLTVLIYSLNVIATIGLTATGIEKYHSYIGILLAIIYLLVCPILAFISWHYPLYKVLKTDSTIGYIGYFIAFGIQLAFDLFLAIGIFDGGGGGLIGTIDMFRSGHLVAGLLCLACTAALSIHAVLGFLLVRQVAVLYRHGGHSPDQARNELLQNAAMNPSVQSAAFRAVFGSNTKGNLNGNSSVV